MSAKHVAAIACAALLVFVLLVWIAVWQFGALVTMLLQGLFTLLDEVTR